MKAFSQRRPVPVLFDALGRHLLLVDVVEELPYTTQVPLDSQVLVCVWWWSLVRHGFACTCRWVSCIIVP